MKKLVFVTLACIAMTSCVNEEIIESPVAFKQNQEIVFDSPIMGSMTKNAIETVKYPTTIPFRIYASINSNQWSFMNEKVSFKDGIWKPEHIHYWPHENDVSFVAFSPEERVKDYMGNQEVQTPHANILENTLIITNYGVETNIIDKVSCNFEANKQPDLLVSKVTTIHKDDIKTVVPITFLHALSYIKFTATASVNNEKIRIKSISIESIHNVGTLKVPLESDPKISWEFSEKQELIKFRKNFEKSLDITNLPPNEVLASWLVLPQDLSQAYITVVWEFQNGGTGGQFTEQTTKKELTALTPTGWLPGKKYTYNLTITLDEILFAPSVTLWEDTITEEVPLK